MNGAAENDFLFDSFMYGFPLLPKIAQYGSRGAAAEKLYGGAPCRVKPAGAGLLVSSVNFTCRQPPGYTVNGEGEDPYAGLFHDQGGGGAGGYVIGKTQIRKLAGGGYTCSGVAVAFLPEFIETFITSRHGISAREVDEAVAGLRASPFIPDAALILDAIGGAAFSDTVKTMWIEAKSLELFSVILDWRGGQKAPALNEQDRLGISRAPRYVEEHLAEPLDLRSLAAQASMSRSKFTALFKNQTGLSAAAYVRQIRMEKALGFVQNTGIPLGEIAALVGYRKHSNFSHVFRDCYGLAPGQMRGKITG
jgi:AraC-like DNA-binding protein